jgi:hypothetical protein
LKNGKTLANYSTGINIQNICKEFKQATQNKTIQLKQANDLNRHFSKEGKQMANKYIKMFSNTNYQGNAYQNHSEACHGGTCL